MIRDNVQDPAESSLELQATGEPTLAEETPALSASSRPAGAPPGSEAGPAEGAGTFEAGGPLTTRSETSGRVSDSSATGAQVALERAPEAEVPGPADRVESETPILAPGHLCETSLLESGEPRYFNRELSWLAFNHRVLDEAANPAYPLLERVRFLAISDSNLDEFYMVRVATLYGRLDAGVDKPTLDGLTLEKQLELIHPQAHRLMLRQQEIWRELQRSLGERGIQMVRTDDLDFNEQEWLRDHFLQEVLPVLTPIAVDPAHPFPLIPNDGLSLVLRIRDQSTMSRWLLIVLPPRLRRFIRLPDRNAEELRLLPLEEAIPLFFRDLLPNFEVQDYGLLHVLRASDTAMEISDPYDDLLEAYRAVLRERRRGDVIRLTVTPTMAQEIRDFLIYELDAEETQFFEVDGLLNLSDLHQIIPDGPSPLKFPRYEARFPDRVRESQGDYFAAIAEKDLVVHHPYESFDVVVEFLQQAARDPNVLAIKQTLYRTTPDSPIVRALIEAAEAGKAVTAVIELKARFDEETNMRLAQRMERAGVQVVFGFTNLKTHIKLSLILRRESRGLRGYMHCGTGNYHPVTARVYSDISLFTCDDVMVRDTARIFNYITGYAVPDSLEKLSISPLTLKQELLQMIGEEAERARQGQPAAIWAKMNSLVDPDVIDGLYQASRAGVQVRLVVRGICCLRPGVPGLSENIQVKSIVGRFLEHSRIFCFGEGHRLPSRKARVFIASADWMPRNFHGRVESLVPVEADSAHAQLLEQIMVANLKDTANSWLLSPDGSYARVRAERSFSAHNYFMTNPSLSGRGSQRQPSNPELRP